MPLSNTFKKLLRDYEKSQRQWSPSIGSQAEMIPLTVELRIFLKLKIIDVQNYILEGKQKSTSFTLKTFLWYLLESPRTSLNYFFLRES